MRSAAQILPFVPATAVERTTASAGRFTLDGDAGLEQHLARICALVQAGVEGLVPASRLEGILLGGGYGRGEGGVRHTEDGDQPYNDMEFYLLLRGNITLNELRYRAAFDHLAHELSAAAGIEVEFKVTSLARLRRCPVTMFSYDLVMGHRWASGHEGLLRGCRHHERAADIPLSEATRLLMNRCTGLLLAAERLDRTVVTANEIDFVTRNLAKARLGLGDAVLAACGQYHWSCRERGRRLAALEFPADLPGAEAIRAAHARGVEFKLHPYAGSASVLTLRDEHAALSALAQQVWLWLESRRLGVRFPTSVDYALHPASKCPETSTAHNWLVNLRRFGPVGALASRGRYPRERLLRALPVLLWQPGMLEVRAVADRLQTELRSASRDPTGLRAAYLRLWEIFR